MRFSIVLVKSFFQQSRLDLVRYYCRYLRTHTYSQSSILFTLSDDRKYGCVCRLLHAIVVVQCGKDLTKDECMLRTRPVNRWPKKAWKSGRLRELEIRQYFVSLVPLWSWMTLCQSSFSSEIPRIKYTKVSGNHLLIHVIITFHWVVPLKSIETSQELADRADNLTGGTVILLTLEVNFLV